MKWTVPLLAAAVAAGCAYTPLLRPARPGQAYSAARTVPLMPQLRDVEPSEEILARVLAQNGPSEARVGKNGIMRARVRVPANRYAWEPSVIVLPRTGTAELTFSNDDRARHVVVVSSDGDRPLLDLPSGTSGVVTVSFDRPGRYWFGCPVSNHAGRGMLGLVIVKGEP